ncbi:spore germination protein GerPC [Fictibacillus phosphorivorans]|uniref:spore germination protein GerPC n=1 Tax=Fictibacillus phosphorivorans TaxID=1221500 RepID=UPI00203D48DE|nr:spore germination protein GerPC [Fictibacillus phosphorivorans]MCM3720167.1 spore germination protein GerPC [Fictibacillus phosphorivorans]MCM3777857.1 spore germination protein GerPC [Fictibacillus phosphorivorans]
MNEESNYYLSKIKQMVEDQNNKIKALEQQVKKLKQQVDTFAEEPKTVEYKFEQLKVEKLEGTLHIGLGHSAESKDLIEQFNIGQNTVQMPWKMERSVIENPNYREMVKEMDEFFVKEAPLYLQTLENKINVPLDDSYRVFILEDVQRQVPGRIKHYLTKYEPKDEKGRKEILQKTKEDIYRGIETFIVHLKESKKDGGGGSELSRDQP